jgi:ATP-binding cassette, subfamily G (WHITE), member 2, PDR
MAVIIFACWYYPIGFYRNAEDANGVTSRGWTMFLLLLAFFMFSSTFAHMVQAGIGTAEAAGNAANALFTFSLIFCG